MQFVPTSCIETTNNTRNLYLNSTFDDRPYKKWITNKHIMEHEKVIDKLNMSKHIVFYWHHLPDVHLIAYCHYYRLQC